MDIKSLIDDAKKLHEAKKYNAKIKEIEKENDN